MQYARAAVEFALHAIAWACFLFLLFILFT